MRDLIVTPAYVPNETTYLTVGKHYTAHHAVRSEYLYTILDDQDELTTILLDGCAHLDGCNWVIVEEC